MNDGSSFTAVLKHGTWYRDVVQTPRYRQPAVAVWCDKCFREPLNTCIGYAGVDLCLPCADALAKQIKHT
jgi:hypothetical protein